MINIRRVPAPPLSPPRLVSAREAAAALGIRPETLYAYVSRGVVARHRRPGARGSWFDPVEIDRLAGRRGGGRPEREIRIASAVTALAGGHWFYRGHDPVRLARAASFERVAELLWRGTLPDAPVRWTADPAAVALARRAQGLLRADAIPVDRMRVVTVALAAADPFRHDLRPEAVTGTARRLLATLVESLPAAGTPPSRGTPDAGLAARLWTRLVPRAPRPAEVAALDAALVLLADHELAGSTIAVRTAAALRADPYGAIGAGLGVLGGALHGAVSVAAEELLRGIAARGSVDAVVEAHVRRGAALPGVGHSIYPGGDPRARALLALLPHAGGDRRRLRQVEALCRAVAARGLPPPNVDLGIAALGHALGFPAGTGELLFAIARTAGWVAHALEEYAHPSTIRPRAVYTGPPPCSPAALEPSLASARSRVTGRRARSPATA